MKKNLSFYKHEKIKDNKKTITRSSALFLIKYSKKDKIYTDFHFLNYWLIKGNLKNVKIKITVRNLDGKKILSNTFFINDLKSYCVKLENLLLKKKIQNFTGTGEIEILSKKTCFFRIQLFMQDIMEKIGIPEHIQQLVIFQQRAVMV